LPKVKRGAAPPPPTGRRRRGEPPPPPPPPRKVPRLAAIKMQAWKPDGAPQSKEDRIAPTVAMIGGSVMLAILGAAWIGGSLVNASDTAARSVDSAFASLGFPIRNVRVDGISGLAEADIKAAINPEGRAGLVSIDPKAARARIEALDWIDAATVRRLWPDTLVVTVNQRAPIAIWQEGQTFSVVDSAGERMHSVPATRHKGLLLVRGEGANAAAYDLASELQSFPELKDRIAFAVRRGSRRWDAVLANGTVVALPETGVDAALALLAKMHQNSRILDSGARRIDLREAATVRILPAPDRLARVAPPPPEPEEGERDVLGGAT
jgi:cell division protein FtsQ